MTRDGYRLKNPFARKGEEEKINPKSIFFLSVEGDHTERDYFECLNDHLDNATIQLHVLGRRYGEGHTQPRQVLELIQEFREWRDGDAFKEEEKKRLKDKYSEEFIDAFLNNEEGLDPKKKEEFRIDLRKIGIDADYYRFSQIRKSEDDFFAVVIDRDSLSHTRKEMEECLQECIEKGYGFYVSNPCFEFFLLLHVHDVENSSAEEKEALLANARISGHNTYVSRTLSEIVHHGKKIKKGTFNEHYFPNIRTAIKRAEKMAHDFPELFDGLGTNLGELLIKLGFGDGEE